MLKRSAIFQRLKKIKIASGSSPNWSDLLGPFLPWVNNTDCWELCSDKPNCKENSETRDLMPGRSRNQLKLHGRDLEQESCLESTLYNMLSCLQTVQCIPGFQLLWVIAHAGVGFRGTAVFEPFLLCKEPLINIPVTNPNKMNCFNKLEFCAICTLICYQFPVWGE